MGVTVTTFYRWKSKFGGMEVSDARRLHSLEDENRRLAGTGSSGSSGSFGAATSAAFNLPLQIALCSGTRDLYIAEGTTYGVGMVAGANPAVVTSASLSAGPAPVNVYPDQTQFVGGLLKDGAGATLLGRPVTFALDSAGLPGGWLSGVRSLSGGTGVAFVNAGVGLAPGAYGVIASALDLHGTGLSGSPLSIPISAVAPPSRLVFSAVNQSHVYSAQGLGVPGPGALAQLYLARAVTVASTGVVYYTDSLQQIYQLQPSGLVSVLVPSSAGFLPFGLTLDESKGLLYFGDTSGYVRSVSVVPPIGAVSLVAGAPSGSNADGPATATTLYSPSRVKFVGGKIYVSDRTGGLSSRLRRIDPVAGTIETYLFELGSTALKDPMASQTSCTAPSIPPLVFNNCGQDPGCSVAVAPPPDGRLYVSGIFCGSLIGGGNKPAIVRVESNGSLTLIAIPLALPALAGDASGNLYTAINGTNPASVGYYAADTNKSVGPSSFFVPLAQGTVGAEYVDQSATAFSYPTDVAFGNGHLWVVDSNAIVNALRVLW